MVRLVAEREHKKIGGHRIGVVRRTLHGKTVNFTQKGRTPWETKVEKRIKSKVKSRKPANRQKKEAGKIAEARSAVEVVGFAYGKPTIPETLQRLLGEYQENFEAMSEAPDWAITHY